jgi:hypothetical protein
MATNGLDLAANLNINFASGSGRIKQPANNTNSNVNQLGVTSIVTNFENGNPYYSLLIYDNSSRNSQFFLANAGGGSYNANTMVGDNVYHCYGPLTISTGDPSGNGVTNCGIRMDSTAFTNKGICGMYTNKISAFVTGQTNNFVVRGDDSKSGLILTNQTLWTDTVLNNLYSGGVTYGGTNFGWLLRVNGDMPLVIIPTVDSSTNSLNKGCYIYPNSGGWVFYSDRRLKKDIVYMENALDKVLQLKPCTFKWKNEEGSAPLHHGFIAQDVQELFPDIVSCCSSNNEEKYLGLATSDLIPVLTQSIKDQHTIIMNQQKQIGSLQSQINDLQIQLQTIMKHLNL